MKTKNIIFFIFLIMLILFIGFGITSYNTATKAFLGYNFDGTVEHIEYDTKGYPEVTINGEQYPLMIDWDYNHIIEEGDSLKKDSGKIAIILVKHKNGKRYIFRSR